MKHVEVAYPGSVSTEFDEALNQLAKYYSGRWVASGCGILTGNAQRDIEFRFKSEANATAFVEACRKSRPRHFVRDRGRLTPEVSIGIDPANKSLKIIRLKTTDPHVSARYG